MLNNTVKVKEKKKMLDKPQMNFYVNTYKQVVQ
jgi:hypothetical protein